MEKNKSEQTMLFNRVAKAKAPWKEDLEQRVVTYIRGKLLAMLVYHGKVRVQSLRFVRKTPRGLVLLNPKTKQVQGIRRQAAILRAYETLPDRFKTPGFIFKNEKSAKDTPVKDMTINRWVKKSGVLREFHVPTLRALSELKLDCKKARKQEFPMVDNFRSTKPCHGQWIGR